MVAKAEKPWRRALVCGGRDYLFQTTLFRALDAAREAFLIESICQGEARGADALAASWADSRGIPCQGYRVTNKEWTELGKKAGVMRNQRMLSDFKPHVGLCFPGGDGTDDMTRRLLNAGIPTYTTSAKGWVRVRSLRSAMIFPSKAGCQENEDAE